MSNTMSKQFTQYFPTLETFVAAYGQGKEPVFLTMSKDRNLDINGKQDTVLRGETVIGFDWSSKHGPVYRVPGIGFLHHSEV